MDARDGYFQHKYCWTIFQSLLMWTWRMRGLRKDDWRVNCLRFSSCFISIACKNSFSLSAGRPERELIGILMLIFRPNGDRIAGSNTAGAWREAVSLGGCPRVLISISHTLVIPRVHQQPNKPPIAPESRTHPRLVGCWCISGLDCYCRSLCQTWSKKAPKNI